MTFGGYVGTDWIRVVLKGRVVRRWRQVMLWWTIAGLERRSDLVIPGRYAEGSRRKFTNVALLRRYLEML